MAGNIKGIVIEIEGKSSGLVKELDKVNKNLKETEGQLKTVDKALKLDPANVELVATKQKLLQTAIDQTRQKLELEKQAAQDAGQALADGTITSNEYNTLQAAIAETTGKLADFSNGAEESSSILSELGAKALDVAGFIGTGLANATAVAASAMAEGFATALSAVVDITAAIGGAVADVSMMVAGAVADLTTEAVQGYASIEQLEGGMEKLYGTDAQQMINQANNAFLTAGMSAERYMETATSFSASLISGLGGDTAEAARIADIAIRSMSDNANTFGTDISSIESAYRGFARGNFTMLDNLSLGFAGTKQGMIDLVNASGILENEIDNLDDVSFDQMVLAIDQVQQNMNIAGTTTNEALSTIEGSINATKVAWSNFVTGLADPNADISSLISNMVTGAEAAVTNVVPAINQALGSMTEALPEIVEVIATELPQLLNENLPSILDAIAGLAVEIAKSAPELAESLAAMIPPILDELISTLEENSDTIIEGVFDTIEIVGGVIIDNAPTIVDAVANVIETIAQRLPQLIEDIARRLPQLIRDMLPTITSAISALIQSLVQVMPTIFQTVAEVLPDILESLLQVITDNIDMIVETTIQCVEILIQTLINNLPMIIDAAAQIIVAIVTGLAEHADELIPMMIELVITMITELLNHLDEFIGAAVELFFGIVTGIVQSIPEILGAIGSMIGDMLSALTDPEALGDMLSAGAEMLGSFVDGLMSQIPIISSIWNGIKSMFGVEEAYASGIYESNLTEQRKQMLIEDMRSGKDLSLIYSDMRNYEEWAGQIRAGASMEDAHSYMLDYAAGVKNNLRHQNVRQTNMINGELGRQVASNQRAQADLYANMYSQTTVNIGGNQVANVVNNANGNSSYRNGGH